MERKRYLFQENWIQRGKYHTQMNTIQDEMVNEELKRERIHTEELSKRS